jgi:hypothetical protein
VARPAVAVAELLVEATYVALGIPARGAQEAHFGPVDGNDFEQIVVERGALAKPEAAASQRDDPTPCRTFLHFAVLTMEQD